MSAGKMLQRQIYSSEVNRLETKMASYLLSERLPIGIIRPEITN